MLPPHSLITRVSSWTIPVLSLPIAETAKCCFIVSVSAGIAVLGSRVYRESAALATAVPGWFRRDAGEPRTDILRPSSRHPGLKTSLSPLASTAAKGRGIAEVTTGSLVAIVTPMSGDGAIDFSAWDRLIEWHIDSGTQALVIGGTTGESATLTEAELHELAERASARAAGRIGLVVGAGTSSTAVTAGRAHRLSELPIDALLVVTPAYNRPTQEGLYRHFAAVAEAASKPLILYNVPARTSVDMLPATIGRLSQLPGIAAVKEAVPGSERVRQILAASRSGFVVLSGDDATAREAILAGARGVISVSANVAPKVMAQMVAAALRGDAPEAARLDAPLQGLHRALFLEPNPIPVKWALAQLGRIGPGMRLPMTELSESHRPGVLAAVRGVEPMS